VPFYDFSYSQKIDIPRRLFRLNLRDDLRSRAAFIETKIETTIVGNGQAFRQYKIKAQTYDPPFDFVLSPSTYFARHFAVSSLSESALINTPPTTLRAWKPICFPFLVSYQSVSGTRVGVSSVHV